MYTVYFYPNVCEGTLNRDVTSAQLRLINDLAQDPSVCLTASDLISRPVARACV